MNSKLKEIFADVLGVAPEAINEETSVDNEAAWDSLRHMNLIFAIEDGFGVRFEDDEIATLTSFRSIERAILDKAG